MFENPAFGEQEKSVSVLPQGRRLGKVLTAVAFSVTELTFAEIMVSHFLKHISCSGNRFLVAVALSLALPAFPCAEGDPHHHRGW